MVRSRLPDPGSGLLGRLGPMIARERTGRGLSIEELARRSGISAGLLSQLERGIGNPSIETLSSLARALGVPIGSFFDGPSDPVHGVIHPHTRKRLVLSDQKLTYQLLVPDVRGALGMLYIELPAAFSNEHAPFSHPGEEAILVLRGRLELHEGDRVHTLDEGDSIRIASIVDHWYRTFDDEVVVISAMTPPSF